MIKKLRRTKIEPKPVEPPKPKLSVVTGGAGFIGSNLVDAIIKNGHRCIIIDDLSSGYEKNIKINSSISFISLGVNLLSKEPTKTSL